MTQNLPIRWKKHAVSAASARGVDFYSLLSNVQDPVHIIPGNRNLREVFIIQALVSGNLYPVAVPVSAGTNGQEVWLTPKSVIPKREYKSLFEM